MRVQRKIADYEPEPLTAVIPGVTLAQIWQIIGVADRGFRAVSLLVIALVLLAMTAMTVLSTDSRRREMAILRALGASPSTLVGLILAEALFLAICASVLGLGLAVGVSALAQQWLTQTIGLVATGNAARLAGNGHRRLYHSRRTGRRSRAGFAPLSAHGAGWHYGGTLMRHFLTGFVLCFLLFASPLGGMAAARRARFANDLCDRLGPSHAGGSLRFYSA